MEHLSSFYKGIDQDTSRNLRVPGTYYSAENLRFLSEEPLKSGNLSNPKGNKLKFTFQSTDELLVGSCTLGNGLILFTKGSGSGNSKIYYFEDDNTTTSQPLVTTTIPSITDKFRLIYSDATHDSLNFSDNVKAVGRYENSSIQKVYWVDGVNPIRSLNIIYDADTNDFTTFEPSDFNLISDIDLSTPTFDSYSGGNLDTGTYCYSYQLYNYQK